MKILRLATISDINLLQFWDTQEHIINCHNDTHDQIELDWSEEINNPIPEIQNYIIQHKNEAIGVVQIQDIFNEPYQYWSSWSGFAPNIYAIDIWIGNVDYLNKGFGTKAMLEAIRICFEDKKAKCIVVDPLATNLKAINFYKKLGFEFLYNHSFEDDYCSILMLQLN